MGSSICNNIQSPTNAKEGSKVSSETKTILKVFHDILVHRMYIQNSYDLGTFRHTNKSHLMLDTVKLFYSQYIMKKLISNMLF